MGKAWRIVLTVVIALLVIGVVLVGAAWITGASPARIVELVFGGREGLEAWLGTVKNTAQNAWDAFTAFLVNLF